MGIFDAFAGAGGAELTVDELNEKTKGDKALLGKRSSGRSTPGTRVLTLYSPDHAPSKRPSLLRRNRSG